MRNKVLNKHLRRKVRLKVKPGRNCLCIPWLTPYILCNIDHTQHFTQCCTQHCVSTPETLSRNIARNKFEVYLEVNACCDFVVGDVTSYV